MSKSTPPPPKLKYEPPEWYSRFCAWLLQDKPRSLLAIYNEERRRDAERKGKSANYKDSKCPPGTWDGKPALYKWDERAAIYDEAEAKRIAEEHAKDISAWIKTEVRAARKMMDKGIDALEIPLIRADVVVREEIPGPNGAIVKTYTTRHKGDPQAVKVAAMLIVEASKMARAALLIPAPPPPAPVNALQSIVGHLPKPYLDRILAGEPVDVVFAAWASEHLQTLQAKKE